MSPDGDADRSVSLKTLVGFLLAFSAGLFVTVGLPHAPAQSLELPDPSSLEALLRSPHPPLEGAIYVAGMLGWGIWAWLVLSLVLQLGVAAGERVAGGTTAVRRASNLADLLSAPLVRKAVRSSLAGSMLARVALAGVPVAAAAPVERPALVHSISPQASSQRILGPQFWATSREAARDIPPGATVYTVQPGDNLVEIAERFYADGDKWQLLYETNQGRQMADGRTFDRAGVIQPGWQLVVPGPMSALDTDGQRWYTVRHGDSLAGISARLLGDESRWPELYAANAGAQLDELHVLNNPRLIWPGLRLQLPEDGAPDASGEPNSDASTSAEPSPEVSRVQHGAPAATPAASSPTVTLVTATPTAVATESTSEPAQTPPVLPIILPTPAPTTVTGATVAPNEPPFRVSPMAGAAAGAGLAIVGIAGSTLVLRRRRRVPRSNQAESDVIVRAGFAEAESEDASSDDELAAATAIAARMSRALATAIAQRNGPKSEELPTHGTQLVGVRHGRSSTTLLLQMPMASRGLVFGCLRDATTHAFGRESDVEAVVSRDGDVVIRLITAVDQLDVSKLDDEDCGAQAWPRPSMLLRLGLLADRQLFAANWDALSHVLVAAPLSQSAEAILSGLLTSLVARRSPSQLGFVVLGGPRCLPEELLGLPHRLEPVVDAQDEDSALQLLNRVRQELEERVATGATDAPDLVVVIPELAHLSAEHQVALGLVMLHGPQHRVRVVAGSTRRAVDLVQDCSLVPEFGTRLVLRAADDEESTVLLGSADATELGTGGHLLARLEARVPLQAYGYRVEADQLARLAAAIRIKGIAAEWWERRGGSSEHRERRVDAAEPTIELAFEDFDDERVECTGGEEHAAPRGDSAEPEVNIERSVDVPAEAPEPPSVSDEVESSASAITGSAGLAPSVNGDAHVGDMSSSGAPSGTLKAAATNGLTSGQLWSSATAPRPRLGGRFLGARELIFDGQVVWPMPGQPEEKAMELLVYLGVQDPSGVRAELLADSLWSEDDDDESRTDRLRKRRYRMRQALKKLVPELQGDPIAPFDKKNPVYRLNESVIESDVHRFLKLVQEAKALPPESACAAYEAALDLYGGDLLERPDIPPYRWMDEGPRLVDLRVKYAAIEHQARRRLADLLAAGDESGLERAEELYIGLAHDDPLDHRLWEALARLHERRNDLLGLEASMRRLRNALVELGEGDDLERVIVPPALERVFTEVRTALLRGQAA